jgi:hypothetical protein
MWCPSRFSDFIAGSSLSRSGQARRRAPRRRTTVSLPRPERLEDRSCPSSYSVAALPPLAGDVGSSV